MIAKRVKLISPWIICRDLVLGLFLVSPLLITTIEAQNEFECFETVDRCYHISPGPLNYTEALNYCDDIVSSDGGITRLVSSNQLLYVDIIRARILYVPSVAVVFSA